MVDDEKSGLRRRLRAARRAIPPRERCAAARAVDAALRELGLPRPHTRISAYRAMDGEIDPSIVLQRALALGCDIHLPAITNLRSRRMSFVPLTGAGVPAAASKAIAPRWLDLVLVPLVGFDDRGNRLGMGAAFYDRHFGFLRHRRAWCRPRLVGLAFDLQRVEALPVAPHDVPLWGVVTERGFYRGGAR